jgi:hypothetical protein
VTLTFLSEMSHNFRRFVADISPTEVSMSSILTFNSFDSCDDEALVGESPALRRCGAGVLRGINCF